MSSGRDRPEEQLARTVVSQVTGAVVVRTDDRHAPAGTVDARLHYPNGRTGALEISTLGLSDEFELEARIGAIGGQLRMPGRWKWVISVADPDELAPIQDIYAKAILTCEAHAVTTVNDLPPAVVNGDAELHWLSTQSTSTLFGIQIPEGAQDRSGYVDLIYQPADTGGYPGPDPIVSQVNAALGAETFAKRVAKLVRAEGDEHHLFLRVAVSGLEEYAYARLDLCAVAPDYVAPLSGDPDLPDPVSHLWLDTGWGYSVTRWTRGQGWDHPTYA